MVEFDIRFQVLTLPGRPYVDYRRQVLRVEELGFDVAAVPDHFCDWANPTAPWLGCWTLLAALAAETSVIRLASNVAQIPLRNPGVLAHQASPSIMCRGDAWSSELVPALPSIRARR
jgi:alkanesulfonate monooxygenase SsuD/methylene tetrahydromethanopterin reductase-like flavin-dependent oxidoreductase (luciferase family)